MLEQTRSLIRRIVHADDTPHKIAWGVALGIFVAWTPTVGIQMILAGIAAWLLNGNKVAAIAIVWVSNPYTVIPIFSVNYFVGHALVGGPQLGRNWFVDLVHPPVPTEGLAYLSHAYSMLAQVAWPMWLGSVLVGVPVAMVSYVLALQAVHRARAARQRHEEAVLAESSAETTESSKIAG